MIKNVVRFSPKADSTKENLVQRKKRHADGQDALDDKHRR